MSVDQTYPADAPVWYGCSTLHRTIQAAGMLDALCGAGAARCTVLCRLSGRAMSTVSEACSHAFGYAMLRRFA